MVAIYIILGSLSWNRGKDGVKVITQKAFYTNAFTISVQIDFPLENVICNIRNSFLFAFHITQHNLKTFHLYIF